MNDKVKELGRLRYIEPTNFSNTDGKGYSEDITYPYEDYSMAIDLTIRKTNRYSCGWSEGEYTDINYSSSNSTLSFFSGTKKDKNDEGFLTTKFTDISMTNPGKNTSECLGIESITISYTNMLYPLVNIKFIDVRGATLMSPTEAGYYNNYDEKSLGGSKELYKAFFTMPYPMFILKVKGFYGEGATFKLALHKADIDFDSENGNFIISASFVGYMYGIYTDLPISYIAIAPYMEGGREYWDEKVKDGTFMFRDAYGNKVHEMCKLPELRDKVSQAAQDYEIQNENKINKENLSIIEKRISSLKHIRDNFPFREKEWYINERFNGCQTLVANEKEGKELKKTLNEYYKIIKNYCEAYGDNVFLTFLKPLENIENKDIDNYFDSTGINSDFVKSFNSEFLNNDEQLNLYINSMFNKKPANLLYWFSIEGINVSKILELIENSLYTQEQLKINAENNYKIKELDTVEKIIGFRPSIRNIFNLIFAHMQTFMHCFYEQTKLIKEEISTKSDARKKIYHRIPDDYTDTERSGVDVGQRVQYCNFLPPYVAMYIDRKGSNNLDNTQGKEIAWPERVTVHANELQEVQFINRLLDAGETYEKFSDRITKDISSSAKTANNDINMTTHDFIPLTIYDFCNKNNISNPYLNAAKALYSADDKTLEAIILGTFALRSYYANMTYGPSDLIGKIEALNLYKAMGYNSNTSYLKFIKKYIGNFKTAYNSFKEIITNKNEDSITKLWYITKDNSSLFKTFEENNYDSTTSLNFLKYSYDKEIFPIGTFDFKKIKNDIINFNGDLEDDRYYYFSDNNLNSFTIYHSGDYLENIYNNLASDFTDFELPKEYISFDKVGDDFCYEVFHIKDGKKSWYGIRNRNKVEYIKDITEDKNNINDYFIKYPSVILDGEYDKSFFTHDIYKQNKENIETLAYFFLLSVPIKSKHFGNGNGHILHNNNDGLMPKLLLLREGAYYWYLTKLYEPGIINMEGYKKANEDEEYYFTESDYHDDVIDGFRIMKEGDDMNTLLKYNKWKKPENTTKSRINKLTEYFIDWANDTSNLGFKGNLSRLTNEKLYYDEDYNKGLRKDIENLYYQNEVDALQIFLRDLFFGIDTIFDIKDVFSNKYLGLKVMQDNFTGFYNMLKTLYGKYFNSDDESIYDISYKVKADTGPIHNEDIKLSLYLSLKSLYDKWLCAPQFGPEKTWSLDSGAVKSEFNNFIFTDSFYHDIGDIFTVNINKIANWIGTHLPSSMSDTGIMGYTGKSVYNFFAEVAEDNGALLLAIPQKFGSYDSDRLQDMFKAKSLYDDWSTNETSFVFMYTFKPSEHLGNLEDSNADMNGFDPMGDGIDLTNEEMMGEIVNDDGYILPAFGVTFAKQNQSIFKNIRLNTANGITTDIVLAATQNIASKASLNPNQSYLFGQDIYKLHNNKAYACEVETLGNIQIMPLMYFQLNNIPMWKGGYQIKKVTHNITAGNFVTKFEGQKINKYAIPIGNGLSFSTNPRTRNDEDETKIKDTGKGNSKENNTSNSGNISRQMSVIEYDNSLNDTSKNQIKTIKGNSNLTLGNLGDIDYEPSKITKENPLICITPAHGPYTNKSTEWGWSCKVVDKIVDMLNQRGYNVHRCNKGGKNTNNNGYSMKETKQLIKMYGSDRVISIVPHWNAIGGKRYEIFLNWKGYERSDSIKLANCMKAAVKEMIKDKNKVFIDNNLISYTNCVDNTVNILPMDWYNPKSDKQDGAPRLDCACILTENWFVDCDKDNKTSGPSRFANRTDMDGLFYNWLISENGISKIAELHVNAIKLYFESLKLKK